MTALRARGAFDAKLKKIKSPDATKRGWFLVAGGLRLCLHPNFEGRERRARSLPTLGEGRQSPHNM